MVFNKINYVTGEQTLHIHKENQYVSGSKSICIYVIDTLEEHVYIWVYISLPFYVFLYGNNSLAQILYLLK